jgi:hypothetical protein
MENSRVNEFWCLTSNNRRADKLVLLAQEEEFEVTKGVFRIRNSKKNIQHYGQNKQDNDLHMSGSTLYPREENTCMAALFH